MSREQRVQAWPQGWVQRAAHVTDADRVAELLNARSQKLYGTAYSSPSDVLAWWEKPGLDLATDLRLVLDGRGSVAGLVSIADDGAPHVSFDCSASVHPRYEADARLWDTLLSWSLERAMERVTRAPRDVCVTAVAQAAAQDEARRAALERAGFAPVRVQSHMRIELTEAAAVTPDWPAGVAVRTADLATDLPAIVGLWLEAWRDHWGFVERPYADALATFVAGIESRCGPVDPTLWFLAVAGDEGRDVAGMSLCVSGLPGDPTGGYICDLGVRPEWRRRGVALALLRHTFSEFRRRGFMAAELDVDAESLTGALRLYERAGLRVIRQELNYEKVLRPGKDLATRELPAAARDQH
ncbi:MAG: N-acetyltransferase [Candidatus Bipolaricaulis sp.]|nr:N-acetyltransferase [Candidatus Bipolaricaulis sp.]